MAGRTGFVVISAAALLATASAINATLFASSNIGYDVVDKGEITRPLTRPVGRVGNVALLVAAACVFLLVPFFPLSAVGQVTSLQFPVVTRGTTRRHTPPTRPRLRPRTPVSISGRAL